jgi:hypothetical protein
LAKWFSTYVFIIFRNFYEVIFDIKIFDKVIFDIKIFDKVIFDKVIFDVVSDPLT